VNAPTAGVLEWDWRGQPDLNRLDRLVHEASGGTVRVHQVRTDSDQYAIVVTTGTLERAQTAYDQYNRNGGNL
jgi:hypothetical protein